MAARGPAGSVEAWVTRLVAQVEEASASGVSLDEFMRRFDEALLEAAQRVLVPELKKTLSILGPPPSEPFTPPRRQSDEDHQGPNAPVFYPHLQESIRAWRHPSEGVVVGADNNPYALFLEIGTQTMAPRPWLAPTLQRADVQAAFARALSQALAKGGELPDDAGADPGA